jgi:hypothetical protein
MVLLLAEWAWAVECREASRELCITGPLRRFADVVPLVAYILGTLPPPPERVRKDRRCSAPSCNLDGAWMYHNMEKYNRCKAVYYSVYHCSKFRQEDPGPSTGSLCEGSEASSRC